MGLEQGYFTRIIGIEHGTHLVFTSFKDAIAPQQNEVA